MMLIIVPVFSEIRQCFFYGHSVNACRNSYRASPEGRPDSGSFATGHAPSLMCILGCTFARSLTTRPGILLAFHAYPLPTVGLMFCFLRWSHDFHLQYQRELLWFGPSLPRAATMTSADFCIIQRNGPSLYRLSLWDRPSLLPATYDADLPPGKSDNLRAT